MKSYYWMTLIAVLLLLAAFWTWGLAPSPWSEICASALAIPGGALLLFGIWEWVMDAREQSIFLYQSERKADATTTAVLLAEAMRQLSSTAIDVLKVHGAGAWEVIPGMGMSEPPDHILYGTQVTYEFLVMVLRKSTKTAVVPVQVIANDGAKLYAPARMREGWCTDREQYAQLCSLLYSMGRVTRPHGNRPHEWIGPWTPETVAQSFGVELWDDDEDEAEEPTAETEPATGGGGSVWGWHPLKA